MREGIFFLTLRGADLAWLDAAAGEAGERQKE